MEIKRLAARLLLLAALASTAAQAHEKPATMSSEGELPNATDNTSQTGPNASPPGPNKPPPGATSTPTGTTTAPTVVTPPPPQCRLLRVAEMDLATQTNGTVTVPAKFEGQPGQMLIDTGGIVSAIADTLAIKLRLPGRDLQGGRFELMGGVKMNTVAYLKHFSLGDMPGDDVTLLVAPYTALNNDTTGILAPDIMSHYDVELDFAAAKFRMFDHDHCPGQVVYWTHEPFAAVPFKLDQGNHMEIELVIDGKEMTAAVDTGAERSTMTMDAFEDIFGYRAKSDPAMKVVGHISINGTEPAPIYRYPFKTMTFEGIQVLNPNVEIVEGDRFDPGGPKLVLGIETLRQLHMFIDYSEGYLFLTAAEAR